MTCSGISTSNLPYIAWVSIIICNNAVHSFTSFLHPFYSTLKTWVVFYEFMCFTQQLFIWNRLAKRLDGNATWRYFSSLSLHEFLSLEQFITFCCCIVAWGEQNVEFAIVFFEILYSLVGVLNHQSALWKNKCKGKSCRVSLIIYVWKCTTTVYCHNVCVLSASLLCIFTFSISSSTSFGVQWESVRSKQETEVIMCECSPHNPDLKSCKPLK